MADYNLTSVASGAELDAAIEKAESALQPGDIGTSVQAYDADTAKLDTDQPWTGTQTFKLFGASAGTLTADAPFTLSQTWNNAAVAFTGLKVDVTNTASAASNIVNLVVDGVSKLLIDGSALKGRLHLSGDGAGTLFFSNIYGVAFRIRTDSNAGKTVMAAGMGLGWSSSLTNAVTAADVELFRDNAGILAQRNANNPQAFRIYNTYTSSTNYERAEFAWESNRFHIKTTAETGTDRGITLDAADLILSSLPTTDPAVAGRIWLDGTALKVSAG